MATFADKDGTAWSVALTVGDLEDCKEAGADLRPVLRDETKLINLLFHEPDTLVRVMWVLCHRQAEADGVEPEQFARLFDGPTLERASVALVEAVIDFFPRSKVAATLRANLHKLLAKMDADMSRAAEKRVDEILSGSATSSPASSDSTPAP